LRGGVIFYAAQPKPQINTEIEEKGRFQTEAQL